MATTGRPGVYIYESFSPLVSNTAIPGEALPAIAAGHPRGPSKPKLITSWNDFIRFYGNFTQAPNSMLPFAVFEFFDSGGSQLYVLAMPNSDATNATLTLADIATSPAPALTVTALSPGVWAQQVYIEVVVRRPHYFDLNVYVGGSGAVNLVETFQDMSMDPINSKYAVVSVNSPITGSQYIRVTDLISGDAIPVGSGPFPDSYVSGQSDLSPTVGPQPLTGGADGTVPPDIATVVPQEFDTLPDQVLVINLPGMNDATILNSLLVWCALRTDKFLVIDGPAPDPNAMTETNYNNVVSDLYVSMVKSGNPSLTSSTYAAVYAPWVLIQDPSNSVRGATRWLPPGPMMLGQYNATDISRGVHITPAGTKNVCSNLVSLETHFSQANLDALNDAQVDAIKMVPGVGYCPFGGRTLHNGYPDRYVAVRRMIIKLEHDFKWILKSYLFEPNDYLLWRQITATMTNYLTQQLQVGALGGATPADSFVVVCDNTNNTASLAQAGIVTVDVAVALLSPAEFININLTQFQGTGTQTVTTTTP